MRTIVIKAINSLAPLHMSTSVLICRLVVISILVFTAAPSQAALTQKGSKLKLRIGYFQEMQQKIDPFLYRGDYKEIGYGYYFSNAHVNFLPTISAIFGTTKWSTTSQNMTFSFFRPSLAIELNYKALYPYLRLSSGLEFMGTDGGVGADLVAELCPGVRVQIVERFGICVEASCKKNGVTSEYRTYDYGASVGCLLF